MNSTYPMEVPLTKAQIYKKRMNLKSKAKDELIHRKKNHTKTVSSVQRTRDDVQKKFTDFRSAVKKKAADNIRRDSQETESPRVPGSGKALLFCSLFIMEGEVSGKQYFPLILSEILEEDDATKALDATLLHSFMSQSVEQDHNVHTMVQSALLLASSEREEHVRQQGFMAHLQGKEEYDFFKNLRVTKKTFEFLFDIFKHHYNPTHQGGREPVSTDTFSISFTLTNTPRSSSGYALFLGPVRSHIMYCTGTPLNAGAADIIRHIGTSPALEPLPFSEGNPRFLAFSLQAHSTISRELL
ncbi:hypothetical protein Pcinc_001471 [Petrolisthes cinctipes]|uniref:Uncharacterized protein n=1 Tax=Petrolisthes cinctipes TaxID=88211 RepID=A0AAE1GLH1_PETCI|nr:hypothetical protein Pcinc_001471 [Petrolisthes cinctipes]